jgi:coenzyme F420-0:L-glutamate ligase/coenzyme F420-1:gamma-L-glutamate ligase
MPSEIRVIGLAGLPEVRPGDDLPRLILAALERSGLPVAAGDVFVVTQKVVSKAEGRLVSLDEVTPSLLARRWAAAHDKDPRVVEVVLSQAARIVRMERGILIAETAHGFVCANAGVDASNVPPGTVSLLPEDPDASAERLRRDLVSGLGRPVGVVISDTFGRPWRRGLVNVAIGVAGLSPVVDHRGTRDGQGRPLRASVIAVADEMAGAAELAMGKTEGVPVALVQGATVVAGAGRARDLVRPREDDLFP